uniref:Uncharacterized protein n=1 Tax=Anguilla anguilla TaxID=7936 RepID=A0A0E9TL13_ANGAN
MKYSWPSPPRSLHFQGLALAAGIRQVHLHSLQQHQRSQYHFHTVHTYTSHIRDGQVSA